MATQKKIAKIVIGKGEVVDPSTYTISVEGRSLTVINDRETTKWSFDKINQIKKSSLPDKIKNCLVKQRAIRSFMNTGKTPDKIIRINLVSCGATANSNVSSNSNANKFRATSLW